MEREVEKKQRKGLDTMKFMQIGEIKQIKEAKKQAQMLGRMLAD